jgi:hypothetical protein
MAGHELACALARTGPTALVHGDLHLANILIAYQPRQPDQQVRQRIAELGGLVPGLDGDRLWAWCQASAIIIVVQHLHNRPADSRIPFLLQLAAR